jgi:hypothetical protein
MVESVATLRALRLRPTVPLATLTPSPINYLPKSIKRTPPCFFPFTLPSPFYHLTLLPLPTKEHKTYFLRIPSPLHCLVPLTSLTPITSISAGRGPTPRHHIPLFLAPLTTSAPFNNMSKANCTPPRVSLLPRCPVHPAFLTSVTSKRAQNVPMTRAFTPTFTPAPGPHCVVYLIASSPITRTSTGRGVAKRVYPFACWRWRWRWLLSCILTMSAFVYEKRSGSKHGECDRLFDSGILGEVQSL